MRHTQRTHPPSGLDFGLSPLFQDPCVPRSRLSTHPCRASILRHLYDGTPLKTNRPLTEYALYLAQVQELGRDAIVSFVESLRAASAQAAAAAAAMADDDSDRSDHETLRLPVGSEGSSQRSSQTAPSTAAAAAAHQQQLEVGPLPRVCLSCPALSLSLSPHPPHAPLLLTIALSTASAAPQQAPTAAAAVLSKPRPAEPLEQSRRAPCSGTGRGLLPPLSPLSLRTLTPNSPSSRIQGCAHPRQEQPPCLPAAPQVLRLRQRLLPRLKVRGEAGGAVGGEIPPDEGAPPLAAGAMREGQERGTSGIPSAPPSSCFFVPCPASQPGLMPPPPPSRMFVVRHPLLLLAVSAAPC